VVVGFSTKFMEKEFSELLIVAIPLMKTTSEHTYARKPRFATGILVQLCHNDDAASIDQHKHSYEPTEHGYKQLEGVSNGWKHIRVTF